MTSSLLLSYLFFSVLAQNCTQLMGQRIIAQLFFLIMLQYILFLKLARIPSLSIALILCQECHLIFARFCTGAPRMFFQKMFQFAFLFAQLLMISVIINKF